ncbi:hypothetical protein [Saccharomonospora piscinae]|uniref:hypothetical protein n=1 Tax=Saccharomonospora piscinae TaxID=687388 RepID=UPI001ABE7430|nr:hypothetical protein [Saccharomonospora piscinae]
MGWVHDSGYDRAYEHEGHVVTFLDDGTTATCYPVPPERSVVGWSAGCACGWRGEHVYLRSDWPDTGPSDLPPDDVEGWETGTGCFLEWQAHLRQAVPELAVHDLIADADHTRDQITAAVAHARTAGASWERIGAAAGISRQSAHERWSAATTTHAPTDTLDGTQMGMKKLAYLRLRDLLRARGHRAEQRQAHALTQLHAMPSDALSTERRHQVERELAAAEAATETWKAAEKLLTDFYHQESRPQ